MDPGTLLRNMGRMGIPDTILLKPDISNEEERKVCRCTRQYTFELLAPISYLRHALDIPRSYNEKWDGTGNPRVLKG